MTEEVSLADFNRFKYDRAVGRMTEIAAKKMYIDLLLGDYNRNYEDLMNEHIKQRKTSPEAAKQTDMEKITARDLPPHVMDYVLQPGKSLAPTSFDLIKKDVYHSKIQEQATREESLYTICVLRKQEYVKKWRNFKSFEPEDRASVAKVKKVWIF